MKFYRSDTSNINIFCFFELDIWVWITLQSTSAGYVHDNTKIWEGEKRKRWNETADRPITIGVTKEMPLATGFQSRRLPTNQKASSRDVLDTSADGHLLWRHSTLVAQRVWMLEEGHTSHGHPAGFLYRFFSLICRCSLHHEEFTYIYPTLEYSSTCTCTTTAAAPFGMEICAVIPYKDQYQYIKISISDHKKMISYRLLIDPFYFYFSIKCLILLSRDLW